MWRWEALAGLMRMKNEEIVAYIQSKIYIMPPTTASDTDNLGEGDSHLVLDLLPEDENWMEKLKGEVQFRVMLHRGGEVPRLVAVQVLPNRVQDPYRGRGAAESPSKPRPHTALPLRKGLHLGALR